MLAACSLPLAVICLSFVAGRTLSDTTIYNPNVRYYGYEPVCVDTLCYSQEDCCTGTVCVTHDTTKVGVCAKLLMQPEGKLCVVGAPEEQCAPGTSCKPLHVNVLPLGVCVNPKKTIQHKRYFESCETTMDCDTSSKLCCRIQTPAKGKNRKICSYYDSPLEQCIF